MATEQLLICVLICGLICDLICTLETCLRTLTMRIMVIGSLVANGNLTTPSLSDSPAAVLSRKDEIADSKCNSLKVSLIITTTIRWHIQTSPGLFLPNAKLAE